MRKEFANLLYDFVKNDDRIKLIVADLGFGVFDKIRSDFPNQFINCGASEQLAIGMSVGLALDGYIPIAYSITSFILCRPYEFIRNYANHEKINIKIVGAGRDDDYGNCGFTHHSFDALEIMGNFKEIKTYQPDSLHEKIIEDFLYNGKPSFLSLKR